MEFPVFQFEPVASCLLCVNCVSSEAKEEIISSSQNEIHFLEKLLKFASFLSAKSCSKLDWRCKVWIQGGHPGHPGSCRTRSALPQVIAEKLQSVLHLNESRFGMTTPATVGGKIFLIFYGLIGCAGTILFFNLFLERLITVIAYVMKSCHERQLRRKGVLPHNGRRGSGTSEVDSLAGWKPSVYYVMLILCVASLIISCCASAMYTPIEGWSYFDSLYFCFVAFSTIGFGDLVSSQNIRYESQGLYRFGNFVFILMGVCCIYSLFNVISIVIKQSINWILKKLACKCCHRCQRRLFRSRRNVVMPGNVRSRRNISIETEGVNESDTDGRRLSGEMISMKDFLASNKVSLAIMQKQLSETANGYPRQMSSSSKQNGFSGGVGALAIMNNRLAETSVDR
ncbi:potassium channel subfamily K member 13 isoform X3 [Haemorhous mexicanus]|uniref:potassium channel subfamily K member 13 isoform X3 n=1 Tax=Haemorhous mexicanus TaxID=30427 RepID=UPI0028BEBFB3|nr:potassium channel subfamily K member 13 isoform X3 [Haemorhous mexicanus]